MNFDHKRTGICITGMSGTGKTTLYIDLWKKWKAKYKYAFDPELELARKTRTPYCSTEEQMKSALKKGHPVVYDPTQMFPGDFGYAFDYFVRWTFETAKVLDGPKLLACDEIQKWTRTGIGGVPRSLIETMDAGRRQELDFIFIVNKGLNKLSDEVRGQLTELYVFKTVDRAPLEWLEDEHGIPREQILNLPTPGGYLHKNLETGVLTQSGSRSKSKSKAKTVRDETPDKNETQDSNETPVNDGRGDSRYAGSDIRRSGPDKRSIGQEHH